MALRYEGWDVKSANGGQDALTTAREFKPDAMVLDVMMPDLDGLQVLSRLRQNNDDTPVLFLTAKDSVEDRVTGLTAGGDDYVTKPFSLEEVVARLRGLIRRSQISRPGTPASWSATWCSTRSRTRCTVPAARSS
jgi:two-component system OmpR family response regulator